MSYTDLSPQQFKEAIENEENVVILDVRTQMEAASGSIGGALVVDVLSGNFTEQVKDFDKDKNYYVYCRSGARSAQACQIMAGMKFENLANLKGGIMAW